MVATNTGFDLAALELWLKKSMVCEDTTILFAAFLVLGNTSYSRTGETRKLDLGIPVRSHIIYRSRVRRTGGLVYNMLPNADFLSPDRRWRDCTDFAHTRACFMMMFELPEEKSLLKSLRDLLLTKPTIYLASHPLIEVRNLPSLILKLISTVSLPPALSVPLGCPLSGPGDSSVPKTQKALNVILNQLVQAARNGRSIPSSKRRRGDTVMRERRSYRTTNSDVCVSKSES